MDEITTYWQAQRRWSNASNRVKKSVENRRKLVAGLTIGAALLLAITTQLLSAHGGWHTAGIVFAALTSLTALAAFLAGRYAWPPSTREWTAMRAVAEGLKAEIHPYLAQAGVYPAADLRQRCETLIRRAGSAAKFVREDDLDTKPIPAVQDVSSYLTVRAGGQIGYYERTAPKLLGQLARYRRWEVGLSIGAATVAAVLGVLTSFWEPAEVVNAWVAVAAASGGAISTHVAGSHYGTTARLFIEAAAELRTLVSEWKPGPDEAEVVAKCEAVIARESESWAAALTTEE